MDQIYKGTEEDRMEPYYYSKMNKVQQAAYHAIRQGLLEISDSIQIPGMEAEELYNVFFRLRLDHPEIFWATGYKYKYYSDSPNFIFIPEYLFDKNKIKEHCDHTPDPERIAQYFHRFCNSLTDADTLSKRSDDLMRIWLF